MLLSNVLFSNKYWEQMSGRVEQMRDHCRNRGDGNIVTRMEQVRLCDVCTDASLTR